MGTSLTALVLLVTVGFLPAVSVADNSIYGQRLDAPGPGYRQQATQFSNHPGSTTYFHSVVPHILFDNILFENNGYPMLLSPVSTAKRTVIFKDIFTFQTIQTTQIEQKFEAR